MPFQVFRGLGFPGAEDLANMFEYQAILGEEFYKARDPKLSRELNPALQDFSSWLKDNGSRIAT